MDKKENIIIAQRDRQGFALMITLSVLSVVIALTVVLLSYFGKVKEDAKMTEALIQADIYYADILSQLKNFKNPKTIFQKLYRFPVSLNTPDGRFTLTLSCRPLAAGININWLAMERTKGKQKHFQVAQVLYEVLAEDYKLEDADRLLEMILQEIALGKKFVKEEQSRLIKKHGIISYQQFSEIIKRYEIEVDDPKVSKVPWKKYFSFSNYAEKIDAEYSSAELISYLFDIDLSTVREWMALREKPPLSSFVNENGGNYGDKKSLLAESQFLEESRCSVRYGEGYRFTFDYIKGGAKYFEFHGKH